MPKLTKEELKEIEEYIKSFPEEEREEKLKEITSKLSQESQCPFCLMSEGKINTTKIYEDENFLAVLEINPANTGHTLLFPKRHIKYLSELTEQETVALIKIIKKLNYSLSKLSNGVSTIINEGEYPGQKFYHLTLNLIPRSKKDDVIISWKGKEVKDLEKTKEKIIENFPEERPRIEEQPVDEERIRRELKKFKKRLP